MGEGTHFSRMVYSMGMPVMPVPAPGPVGKVLIADYSLGNDAWPGTLDQPLKTITRAMALATAGSVIGAFPTADFREAAAVSVTLDNIALVNLSRGNNKCTIKPAAGVNDLAVDVQGNGFRAYGFQFHGVGALKAGVRQRGDYYSYADCDFMSDNYVGLFLSADPAGTKSASEGLVQSCWFRECGSRGLLIANGAAPLNQAVTTTKFVDCDFFANTGADIGDQDNAVPAATTPTMLNMSFNDLRFWDRNKAVYMGLGTSGTSTAQFRRCWFAVDTVARLSVVQVALGGGMHATEFYDCTGLVNTQAF